MIYIWKSVCKVKLAIVWLLRSDLKWFRCKPNQDCWLWWRKNGAEESGHITLKQFGPFHSHHQTGKSASQSDWLQRSVHKPGDPIPRTPRPYSTYHTLSAYDFYLRCGLWVHLSRNRAWGQASNQNPVSVRDRRQHYSWLKHNTFVSTGHWNC